jgi:hypothetical protein
MAQFSVAPVQSPVLAAAAPAPAASVVPDALSAPSTKAPTKEERAYDRSVSAAVQTLNDIGYAGAGPVIKVVETSTNEVIQQWPTQYVLQLAADSQKSGRDSG